MRRLLLAAAAGGLALAGAPPANASVDVNCTMAGHMDIYALPMEWGPSRGNWGLDSWTATCQGTDEGAQGSWDVQISGSGTYNSTVCEDATFDGKLTIGLPFGGTAIVRMTDAGGSGPVDGAFDDGFSPPETLAGSVTMTPNTAAQIPTHGGTPNHPQPPPPLTNTCIDEMAVDMSFAIAS